MVFKIFLILMALCLGYVAIWSGDGLAVALGDYYAWMISFGLLAAFGLSGIFYFQARAEESADVHWLGLISFLCGEAFFGISAKPISAHAWASPWLIFFLLGAIPLFIEIRDMADRKSDKDSNVLPLHRK